MLYMVSETVKLFVNNAWYKLWSTPSFLNTCRSFWLFLLHRYCYISSNLDIYTQARRGSCYCFFLHPPPPSSSSSNWFFLGGVGVGRSPRQSIYYTQSKRSTNLKEGINLHIINYFKEKSYKSSMVMKGYTNSLYVLESEGVHLFF